MSDYQSFFKKATGYEPYPYQRKLGEEKEWPEFLHIPTGLGKTAAIILAWVWKRYRQKDPITPRRLVYCIPMRVLVEQVHTNVTTWLSNLELLAEPGKGEISVSVIMGGSEDVAKPHWASYPEEDMILIGTQDMLLSRALMRGYGMSRYQWPVHFALLHNDTLWVLDEVQLMGAGLPTSCQLEGFRKKMNLLIPSKTFWISATLKKDWFETIDLKDYLSNTKTLSLSDEDIEKVKKVREAPKELAKAKTTLSDDKTYSKNLAQEILKVAEEQASLGDSVLVIINTVERAQELFQQLLKEVIKEKIELILIHSRFRPPERKKLIEQLITHVDNNKKRIIVTTQVVEAGVDISSKILFTELAPWASMVQRFGRCNRYGEYDRAKIFWIDITNQKLASPYDNDMLEMARAELEDLKSASPSSLPSLKDPLPLYHIIRLTDFLELFNTEPDLGGFDVDISLYIRESDNADCQVFWRNLAEIKVEDQPPPKKDEICSVSIAMLRDKYKYPLYYWDSLSGKWIKTDSGNKNIRPGVILMLDSNNGGYSPALGFHPSSKAFVEPLAIYTDARFFESYDHDWRSYKTEPVTLEDHHKAVVEELIKLCETLNMEENMKRLLYQAALWHDTGKAHPVFQKTMKSCPNIQSTIPDVFLAKSPCQGRHERPHFRHEMASMLYWIEYNISQNNREDEDFINLVAFLVASHHGKIRMSLRSMPGEKEPENSETRFARGIWEGDTMPSLELKDPATSKTVKLPEVPLRLDIMEIGEGKMGCSWSDRVLRLLKRYGPFTLSMWETLLRVSDWRGSNKNTEEA